MTNVIPAGTQTKARSSSCPPGPKESHQWLVNLHIERDFFGFLETVSREYGDFVRIPQEHNSVFLVSRSDLIQQIFANDLRYYKKPAFIMDFGLRYGDITLTDEVWRRRSRVVRPALMPRRMLQSADAIVACARDMTARWKPGEVININHELRILRLRIAARTILDADIEGFGNPSENAERSGLIPLDEALGEDFVVGPKEDGPPFAKMVRRRSLPDRCSLVEIIRKCFNERRDRGDIFSYLLKATYDDGTSMSFEELAEEMVLLFFSAHYTIPLVMANLWYQLASRPDIEQKLHRELDDTLKGRLFGADDLANLPYGKMLIKETVRMFPPAPVLYREVIEETELDGAVLKVGDYLLVYSRLLHYDQRYFEEPERFKPERFDPSRDGAVPQYAYLPFGAGPRICMGQALAMLEMRIVLTTIAERYRLVHISEKTNAPKPFFVEGSEQPTFLKVEERRKT